MDLSTCGKGCEMEFAGMATQERVVSGSFDTKERVKQAIDIVDLVGSHIQLRRQGRNYVGLCPWHDDSRPSLQVNPERQSFKCWVCDIGGDVFSFVMKIEGVEFPEALAMLADRAGIAIEKPRSNGRPSRCGRCGGRRQQRPKRQTHALQAMAWAEKQYHDCLLDRPEAEPARNYLARARHHGREHRAIPAWASRPPERDWILRQRQAASARRSFAIARGCWRRSACWPGPPAAAASSTASAAGCCSPSATPKGRPVGMGGRVLPELGSTSPAKYVNSPETPLFAKSHLLYGLDLAREAIRKSRTALVMEGYTD